MGQGVDRRVRIIAELLRKYESLAPGDSHATGNNGNHREIDTEECLTIDELAEQVRLSPAHLRALFSRDLKVTPNQFVKLLKIRNAIELAEEEPRLTISEIVERVRGGDESHFQRDFKKAFGITFGEFRRLCLQQSEKGQEGSGE